MLCYERFGWDYHQIEQLPEPEAKLLSIYFEEVTRYTAEEQRKLANNSNSPTAGPASELTEETTYDPDEDE